MAYCKSNPGLKKTTQNSRPGHTKAAQGFQNSTGLTKAALGSQKKQGSQSNPELTKAAQASQK